MTSFQQLHLSDSHNEFIKNILTHFFFDLVHFIFDVYQKHSIVERLLYVNGRLQKRNCTSSNKHGAMGKIVHKSQVFEPYP